MNLLLLASAILCGDQPASIIRGPLESPIGELIVLDGSSSIGTGHQWMLVGSRKTFLPVDEGRKVVFSSGTPGQFVFVLAVASEGQASLSTHTVVVGTPGPLPPEPGPQPFPPGPGPQPGPTPPPPPPPPPPEPAPIPMDGLRVLIVYESADMTKYPIETQVILAGADVREFLKKNCAAESANRAAFRIYDVDTNVTNDLPVWQQAMARPRSQVPWVIISNGKTGYEGPLPKTPSEFLELIKRYMTAGVTK